MHLGVHEKTTIAVVGLGFALGALLVLPWWLALFVVFVMVPFFAKALLG